MTEIINGKNIAQNLRNQLKEEIGNLNHKIGKVPGLAVVQGLQFGILIITIGTS